MDLIVDFNEKIISFDHLKFHEKEFMPQTHTHIEPFHEKDARKI